MSIITCLHASIVHCCILLHNRSLNMFYCNCIALSILTLCCVFISFQGMCISANILFGLIMCSFHFLQILSSFIHQYFPSCPCTFNLILEFFVFFFCLSLLSQGQPLLFTLLQYNISRVSLSFPAFFRSFLLVINSGY